MLSDCVKSNKLLTGHFLLQLISELGLTGVPVFNTNNNCSSASSALMLARLLLLSGQYKCVLALGKEHVNFVHPALPT